MIAELLSITKIAQNSSGIIQEGVGAVAKSANVINHITGNVQSIASMAKKRIHEYPVVISNAFGDNAEAAFKISRYAESVFAYFLMMSMGIEPVVDKDKSISMHIARFGAEGQKIEYSSGFLDGITPRLEVRCKSEEISKEDAERYMRIYEADCKEYNTARDYKRRYEESREAPIDDVFVNRKGTDLTAIQNKDEIVEIPHERDFGKDALKSITEKFNKSLPTTITVDLYVEKHKIPINIAVKAVPHFIDSEEMSAIFRRCIESGKLLSKLIKLRTGEISFFKDFILNLKQIKEDQELYSRLQRHPWYRRILDRKIKSNVKGVVGLIQSLTKFTTDSNILPTISLVTTTNEISNAISYPYLEAVKTGKIAKIINSLMLLGLFVYDQDRELVHCHFGGIDTPYIIPLKDLTGKEVDKMDKFVEVMQSLMVKNY